LQELFNVVLAGVGGQGVIFASTVLANAAVKVGLSARVGQTFTAAQRGGSVIAHVRVGSKVYSPLIGLGDANVIIGLELVEALRHIHYIKSGGLIILNTLKIPPRSVIFGQAEYPNISEIEHFISEKYSAKVVKIDATQIARSLGSALAANMVMLGVLSCVSEFPVRHEYLIESIRELSPKRYVDLNIKAFKAGKAFMEKKFN